MARSPALIDRLKHYFTPKRRRRCALPAHSKLDLFERLPRKLIFDVAGVQCRSGFEQHYFALYFSERPELDAARHDYQFALCDPFFAFPSVFSIVHAKPALHDQEQLIFVVVMMPGEGSLEFDELNQLTIEFTGDARVP